MATEIFHNKLVRDLIPKILSEKGLQCDTRVLSGEEFRLALLSKLQEEVTEYTHATGSSDRLEELADVVEVILALLTTEGQTFQDLELVREKKLRERGGFAQRIFLEKTSATDPSDKP